MTYDLIVINKENIYSKYVLNQQNSRIELGILESSNNIENKVFQNQLLEFYIEKGTLYLKNKSNAIIYLNYKPLEKDIIELKNDDIVFLEKNNLQILVNKKDTNRSNKQEAQNNSKNPFIFLLIITIILISSILFGYFLNLNYKNYRENLNNYINLFSVTERVLNVSNWLPWVDDYKIKEKESQIFIEKINNTKNEITFLNILFAVILISSGAIIFLLYRKNIRKILLFLNIIAIITLFYGLAFPMLEISAQKNNLKFPIGESLENNTKKIADSIKNEIVNTIIYVSKNVFFPIFDEEKIKILIDNILSDEKINKQIQNFYKTTLGNDYQNYKTFYGPTFFYYNSKSIIELIILLFIQKNFIVGVSILLFSVIMPLTKLIITFLIIFKKYFLNKNFINFIVKNISKWSMADVFVAASFLAYLSFNNMEVWGIETKANIHLGLYYFLVYCILSLLISQLIISKYIEYDQ